MLGLTVPPTLIAFADEVSSEQHCRAERMVARIKARQLAEAVAVKAEAESKEAARQPPAIPSMLDGMVVVMPGPPGAPSTSHRLGLVRKPSMFDGAAGQAAM
jgi:hypothetical protein